MSYMKNKYIPKYMPNKWTVKSEITLVKEMRVVLLGEGLPTYSNPTSEEYIEALGTLPLDDRANIIIGTLLRMPAADRPAILNSFLADTTPQLDYDNTERKLADERVSKLEIENMRLERDLEVTRDTLAERNKLFLERDMARASLDLLQKELATLKADHRDITAERNKLVKEREHVLGASTVTMTTERDAEGPYVQIHRLSPAQLKERDAARHAALTEAADLCIRFAEYGCATPLGCAQGIQRLRDATLS